MDGGHYGTARARLTEILKRRPAGTRPGTTWASASRPGSGHRPPGTTFEGVSGRIRPGPAGAMSAGPGSPWTAAGSPSARTCSVRAAARAGPHVAEARWGLVLLLRMEGRFDEARRCLQAGFDQMSSPVATLQRLYKLDVDSLPIEGIRRGLDRAGKQAPDDDRVWLARAHLAIRSGDLAEADAWLARCLARRPEDPAVWRMKLEWALAADRPDEVRRTLRHLPADEEPAGRVLSLRAWLAAHRHDREAERTRLERMRRARPGRRAGAGTSGRARAGSRPYPRGRGPATIDPLSSTRPARNTSGCLASASPESHAGELARLAGRLGRPFDAARWAALAGPASPGPRPGDRLATRWPAGIPRPHRRSPTSWPIRAWTPTASSDRVGPPRSDRRGSCPDSSTMPRPRGFPSSRRTAAHRDGSSPP